MMKQKRRDKNIFLELSLNIFSCFLIFSVCLHSCYRIDLIHNECLLGGSRRNFGLSTYKESWHCSIDYSEILSVPVVQKSSGE